MTLAVILADDTPYFSKILEKPILSYCINNFLSAEQIQRVLVLLPNSDRKHINGNGLVTPTLGKESLLDPLRVDFDFYSKGEDLLKKVCLSMSMLGAQSVTLAKASSGLIPNWMINDFVYYGYAAHLEPMTTIGVLDEMFEMSFLKFWQLARLASHSDDRNIFSCLGAFGKFKQDFEICKAAKPLVFRDSSQVSYLEFAYSEFLLGTDIDDIIEGLNVK